MGSIYLRASFMKRKNKRLSLISLGVLALGGAVALILLAFEDNIVFFYSPTEVVKKQLKPNQRLRLGGLVVAGSVLRSTGNPVVTFNVTDLKTSVPVRFKGILPDLFREEQGIVAEGSYRSGIFFATEVLAKHDENYMPKEIADALRKSGKWKGDAKAQYSD